MTVTKVFEKDETATEVLKKGVRKNNIKIIADVLSTLTSKDFIGNFENDKQNSIDAHLRADTRGMIKSVNWENQAVWRHKTNKYKMF